MTYDERDLEALLRQPTERLAPPDGSWELVSRRARRRKWAIAGAGGAAVMVILAGAVPAVLAVRHNSNNQTLALKTPIIAAHRTSGKQAPSPVQSTPPTIASSSAAVTAPPSNLAGFIPTSVSFVSQNVGWLWGARSHRGLGVVARSTDGGGTWSKVTAPPVEATDPQGGGDFGIRFADGTTGFVFGTRLFVTKDAGARWTLVTLPGPVVDLEAMNQRIWALVRSCTSCRALTLYGTSVSDPAGLAPVPGVPALQAARDAIEGSVGSIAVNGTAVYVMVGRDPVWSSPDGVSWTSTASPCPAGSDFATAISAWSPTGVAAVCGAQPSAGQETKQVFESTDSTVSWSALPSPPPNGYPAALTAGTSADLILGTTHEAGGFFTSDAGAMWTATATNNVNLSFAGFISTSHVVALPDPNDSSPAFLSSIDAGQTWTVTRFN
jgi:hypothetical protein